MESLFGEILMHVAQRTVMRTGGERQTGCRRVPQTRVKSLELAIQVEAEALGWGVAAIEYQNSLPAISRIYKQSLRIGAIPEDGR